MLASSIAPGDALPIPPAPLEWRGPPLSVVSLGCADKALLSKDAVADLAQAQLIYGSERHFHQIAELQSDARKVVFPSPLCGLREMLIANQSCRIVTLASGDALFYGIGEWLGRWIARDKLRFHPNISSVQSCFHALGLSWRQTEVVSLHGRPLHTLRRHLRQHQRLAVFTDRDSAPAAIAGELARQGYGSSVIRVCEAMGSAEQRIRQFSASALSSLSVEEKPAAAPRSDQGSALSGERRGASGRPCCGQPEFHALNVCIIDLRREPGLATWTLPAFPGIADHLFSTGAKPGYGMISKRETRLTILSLMSPENGEIAWDVGAGCGSVSVEWARWNHGGRIYAIEQSAARIGHLITNSERFGASLNLTPIHGLAPASCAALPAPDCVFIGGSGGPGKLPELLDYAWGRLKPAGKLVASAVTESGVAALTSFFDGKPEREQITLQVGKILPTSATPRTLKPVTVAKCVKPGTLRETADGRRSET